MIRWKVPALSLSCLAMVAGQTLAAPQPKLVVPWELDIEFFDPQRITVKTPSGEHTYWYVLYRVINRSGKDVHFFPSFRLVTNTLFVVEAGDGVHPAVYDRIAEIHQKEFRFFAPPTKVTGPLLQGIANAKESAAVFKTFDPAASSFKVYMAGLAGEKVRVNNPAFDATKEESESNPRYFLMQRTLAISYDLPGDARTREVSRPIRRDRQWVIR